MKIAIANTTFSSEIDAWVNYCNNNNIEVKLVNPYDDNIVENVSDCDIFMWHHSQVSFKDVLFAKQLLFSLQQAGKIVYPNFNSNWHFDDKLGHKYLLEAIKAPIVRSYVFYDKKEALTWAKNTTYPKVFKLRCGAAATNVQLIKSYSKCKKYINKAFDNGFQAYPYNVLKETVRKIFSYFSRKEISVKFNNEKGYIYFQDFMPNNNYDTRVVVVDGMYACAERRLNRKNDFRASGSGNFTFDNIDINIIEIAFNVAKQLNVQSIAYDFVYDASKKPKIVEICFGFGTKGISQCPGYYTDDLKWHKCDNISIYEWIIDRVVLEYKDKCGLC